MLHETFLQKTNKELDLKYSISEPIHNLFRISVFPMKIYQQNLSFCLLIDSNSRWEFLIADR